MTAGTPSFTHRSMRIALWLVIVLVLPLAFVGPSLRSGQRFQPLLPIAVEPLRSEDPTHGEKAAKSAAWSESERALTDLADVIAIDRAWRSGAVPSWDPDRGLGAPLWAATRAGVWYPPNALRMILAPDVAAGWLALFALILAGAGMHVFLAARAVSSAARVLGTWAAQAGGFALVHAYQRADVDAALWLVFAWWSVDGVLAEKRFARPMLALSIALSFLAGCFPIACCVLGATVVYASWRAVERGGLHSAKSLAFPIALGVLIACVQWLPALAAREDSARAPPSAAEIEAHASPPAALITLIAPDVFGAPTDPFLPPRNPAAWASTSRADSIRAEFASTMRWSLYAGVAVLVLALAGIASRPRECALPFVLLALALGFALGWPLVSLAYKVPGLAADAPPNAAAIAWMVWPWLAAIGLDGLLNRRSFARLVVEPLTVALAAVGGIVYFAFAPGAFAQWLPERLAERHGVTLARALDVVPRDLALVAGARIWSEGGRLVLVALGCLAAALIARFVHRDRMGLRAAPWLALVAIEGGTLARVHLAPRELDDRAFLPSSVAIDAARDAAGSGRVVCYDETPSRSASAAPWVRPSLLSAYGLRMLASGATDVEKSLAEIVGALEPEDRPSAEVAAISSPKALSSRVLDLLRVTCVLSRAPLAHPRVRETAAAAAFHVSARSGAFAPARVVPAELTLANGPEAVLALLVEDPDDIRATAVAVASDLPPESDRPRASSTPFAPGRVEVVEPAADRLDATVRGSSGGWLVFHAQFAPGWTATVNGADVPVVRVDHVCRAVPIGAGDSLVRTKYAPSSLRIGIWVSVFSALFLGLISFRDARRTFPARVD